VTEFLKKHTGWEVTELKVAEDYWPSGEPADSLRALLMAQMAVAGKGNIEAARSAMETWKKLTGVADPATINKRGMAPDEIKLKMRGFE
jgi:hypothetical protein